MLLLALGFGTDACMGFPLSRDTASVPKWLAGLLGLGALYLLGEGAAEWIGSREKVTDPLWKRVFHLQAMLALWAALMLVAWLVLKVVT